MKSLKLSLIAFLLLFPASMLAQELSEVPGAFVDIGFGTRPAAMGGAFVGLSDDVNAVVWNPAGLAQVKNYHASFSHANQLGLIAYNYLATSIPLGEEEGLGFALITSGDKALREWTLSSSYGRKLLGLDVGVSLKLRYASFGNNELSPDDFVIFESDEVSEGMSNQVKGNAVGFGFDVGIFYPFNQNLSLGMRLSDIYSPVFWNSSVENESNQTKGKYSETVPFGMEFGLAYRIDKKVIFALDYVPALYKATYQKVKAGMEATFFDLLILRGGVQNIINDFNDEKYSLGLGLKMANVIEGITIFVDYSYMFEELANTQRFGLGFEF
jgi:hypothetical protein